MLTEIASCLGKRIYRRLENWFYRKISSSWNKKAQSNFEKPKNKSFLFLIQWKRFQRKLIKRSSSEIQKFNTRIHICLPITPPKLLPFITHPFNSLSNLLRRYSRHLTISTDSLIDPVTTSSPVQFSFSPLRVSSLVPIGPAWAPRIIHLATYFNINFPDGDTSFASSWPPISPELIIIRVLFCSLPLSCVRKVLLFFFLFFCFFFRDEWWLFWKSKVIIILKLILSFETFLTKVQSVWLMWS